MEALCVLCRRNKVKGDFYKYKYLKCQTYNHCDGIQILHTIVMFLISCHCSLANRITTHNNDSIIVNKNR